MTTLQFNQIFILGGDPRGIMLNFVDRISVKIWLKKQETADLFHRGHGGAEKRFETIRNIAADSFTN